MKKSDFYFELPEELIAQTPLERRDASRLLLLDKKTGETAHRHFYDLPDYLNPGDCLVLNEAVPRVQIIRGTASCSTTPVCFRPA